MRCIVLSILLLCLTASPPPLFAQEVDEAAATRQKAMAKIMPRSLGLSVQIMADGKTLHSTLIENGDELDFQDFIGTTDEQYLAFREYRLGTRDTVREQMQPLLARIAEETDPDKIAEQIDLYQEMLLSVMDDAEAKVAEILSPQQILKIREFELHMNQQMQAAGMPFFNFEAYEALNLTPEQQKQLHEIRDGFRKEQSAQIDAISQIMRKPGEKLDEKEMERRMKKEQEAAENGKKLSARMITQTQSILNKNQLARLEEILKKTPECFTNMLKRRGLPPPKVDPKAFEDWSKAWKPGDPIPKEYRHRDKARLRTFP